MPPSLDMDDIETWAIRKALRQTSGNVSHAAKLLGMSRDTLHTKLKKKGATIVTTPIPQDHAARPVNWDRMPAAPLSSRHDGSPPSGTSPGCEVTGRCAIRSRRVPRATIPRAVCIPHRPAEAIRQERTARGGLPSRF